MTISIPNSTLLATEVSELEDYRKFFSMRDREGSTFVSLDRVSSEAFADLIRAAKLAGDTRTSRALNALQLARQGQVDVKIPNFKAFAGMLQAYLAHEVIDGWIYVESHDGKLYPELVTRVTFHPESHRQEQAMVSIQTTSYWVWLSQWTETDGGGLVGLIIVACGACVWLVVIRILYSHITQWFAPSYIIDDADPTIVRLYGAVRMDGTDGAAQQLLRVRPGLRLGDGDTYAKYGCTLAAVPMTAADQQATDGTEARSSK